MEKSSNTVHKIFKLYNKTATSRLYRHDMEILRLQSAGWCAFLTFYALLITTFHCKTSGLLFPTKTSSFHCWFTSPLIILPPQSPATYMVLYRLEALPGVCQPSSTPTRHRPRPLHRWVTWWAKRSVHLSHLFVHFGDPQPETRREHVRKAAAPRRLTGHTSLSTHRVTMSALALSTAILMGSLAFLSLAL